MDYGAIGAQNVSCVIHHLTCFLRDLSQQSAWNAAPVVVNQDYRGLLGLFKRYTRYY